jgi:hypothetical protein
MIDEKFAAGVKRVEEAHCAVRTFEPAASSIKTMGGWRRSAAGHRARGQLLLLDKQLVASGLRLGG